MASTSTSKTDAIQISGIANNEENVVAPDQPNASDVTKVQISRQATKTVAVPGFVVGEIVWGRIKGWPTWPGKVKRLEPNKYEVIWFNDYRTSKLSKNQIYKFHTNFAEFSRDAHLKVGLSTAIREAFLYVGNSANSHKFDSIM